MILEARIPRSGYWHDCLLVRGLLVTGSVFPLCPHMPKGQGAFGSRLERLYLPRALPPDAVTLGVSVQHTVFGDRHLGP